MRKRLNLSLRSDIYDRLERISEDYDFRGPCEMVTALVSLFIRRVDAAERARSEQPEPDITEEVIDMFNGLADYEPTPTNTHIPVRHRKTKEEY